MRDQCERYWASPISTGEHKVRTSFEWQAFSETSGPIPAGSPIVMPIRGFEALIARERERERKKAGFF